MAWDGSEIWGIMPGTTGNLDPSSAALPAGTAGVALGSGTGQHGTIPIQSSNLGAGVTSAIQEFWDWINEPFTTDMSPASVMILVGVVLVSIVAWNFILYHVRIAAETI